MSEREQLPGVAVLDAAVETAPREVTLGGLVVAVACYYDRTVQDLVDSGETRELELLDAKNVMLTLISDTGLMSDQELAQSIGRKPNALQRRLGRTRARAAEDPKFKEHLEELTGAAAGKPLLHTMAFWPELVVKHYDDLTAEEIAARSNQRKPSEARQVQAYLLAGKTVARTSAIVRRTGLSSPSEVPNAIRRITRLRQADEVFDRQIASLEEGMLPLVPKLNTQRIISNSHSLYGIDPSTVSPGQSPTGLARPKAVNIYLLRDKLGLSVAETMAALNIGNSAMTRLHGLIKEEIAANPMLAAEVDYIEKAETVDFSINQRIVELVAEVTQKDKAEVMAGVEPDDRHARQMAMSLIAERGHAYAPEVAKFFDFTSDGVVRRARFFIKRQLLDDPLLSQQMEWVRQQVFSETLEPFVFEDSAAVETKTLPETDEGELPDIDERLVHPGIKDAVYDIIRETAAYYDRPAIKVLGRDVTDFTLRRARRAAMLRCQQARLPMAEVGVCFDNRDHSSALGLAKTAASEAGRKRVFAEELEALERGEQPRNRLAETLASVRAYYELKQPELRQGRTTSAIRAREAFVAVMSEYDCVGRDQLGKAVGGTSRTVGSLLSLSAKRAKSDLRFRAEVQYLMDPESVPRPPEAEDIVMKIHESYGMTVEDLRQPQTAEALEAIQMMAYILADELPIKVKQVASIIGCSRLDASNYIKQAEQLIAEDPLMFLRVDALRPPEATSYSIPGKILSFTADRHKMSVTELLASGHHPLSIKARLEAGQLLGRYAGYSTEQIAKLFGPQDASRNGHANGNGAVTSAS